jgi:hypothetical protein
MLISASLYYDTDVNIQYKDSNTAVQLAILQKNTDA